MRREPRRKRREPRPKRVRDKSVRCTRYYNNAPKSYKQQAIVSKATEQPLRQTDAVCCTCKVCFVKLCYASLQSPEQLVAIFLKNRSSV